MVHGQAKSQDNRGKKAAELLQQLSGPPRFGKHSLIWKQSTRVASETQEKFFRRYCNENVKL